MKSQIKSGIILSYVFLGIAMLAGLIYTPQMLKMMGGSEYGLYTLAMSIIGYLSFLGLGLESALIRFTAKYVALKDEDSVQKLGGMFIVIYSIIATVTLICGFIVSNHLGLFAKTLTSVEMGKLKILVLVLTINLAISFPMGVFGGVITAHEKFNFRKIVSIVREMALPIVTLLFLHLGYRSVGLVVIHTIFNMLVLVSDFIYARKVLGFKPKFARFKTGLLKEVFQYTIFIFIGTIVDRISNSTNSMVLAATSGTVAVGVFNIAMQLYNYYLNFASSIGSFFFPRIVGMTFTNATDEEVSDLFIKVGRIQLYVIALICSGFVIFGRDFINLWIGADYDMVYYILLVTMIPTVINRSQTLGVQILQARNKHQFRAIVFLFITLFDILISIPLAMRFEGLGAAIGTAIATIIGPILIMNIYYAKKMRMNMKKYWTTTAPILVKIIGITAVGMLLNRFWSVGNWFVLGVQIIIYVVIYGFAIYYMAFNTYEKELVQEMVGKLIRKK